jgi:osmotically-inducible protein OsmY
MDDGMLIFISYPRYAENPPNDEVTFVVRKKLEHLSNGLSEEVTVEAGQGIVYLKGFVNSLATKKAVSTCVNDMSGIRGCVNMVRVRKNSKMSDSDLERCIWDILDDAANPIFKYNVKVKSGNAQVTFYYEDEVYPTELREQIEGIPGIISLNLSGTAILKKNLGQKELCHKIMDRIASIRFLKDIFVRVTYVGNRYLVEGRVKNIAQREFALLVVAGLTKSVSVGNRLRIFKP